MVDVVDKAQELEQRERDDAIARVLIAQSFQPRDPRVDDDCAVCGRPIEPERLRTLNTIRCRRCAHEYATQFEVPPHAR